MKLYYYAILNDNNVCLEVKTKTTKLPKDTDKHVELPDYNTTVIYRKWDPVKQWSHETYEPTVDTVIQDQIAALKTENENLLNETTILKSQNSMTEGMLVEIMGLLAEITKPGGAV